MNFIRPHSRHMTPVLLDVPAHTHGANEEILAMRAANLLNQHYPGHLWAVHVNSEQQGGVMIIKNYAVSTRYGYCLHLNKLDPMLKRVTQAGGEILERAAMKRGWWDRENAKYVEGLKAKHQPISELGIII